MRRLHYAITSTPVNCTWQAPLLRQKDGDVQRKLPRPSRDHIQFKVLNSGGRISHAGTFRTRKLLFVTTVEGFMRLLLAFLLPFTVFFTVGRPIAGVICLLLQITLIGWIPATIWAVYALSQYKTDKKIEKALACANAQ